MTKQFVLLFTLIFFSKLAYGETRHFVHLKAKTRAERSMIASYIHIDSVIEESVYSSVNTEDLKRLKKYLPHLLVETHPLPVARPEKGQQDDIDFPQKDAAYHTYEEMISELDQHARNYPQLVSRFRFGTSVEGRSIPAIRIATPETRQTEAFIPGVLFIGAHHAREHLSTEVPLKLIGYLLENYGKDAQVTRLLDSRDIYFVPMLNPDGAMYDIKGRRYKSWRKNRVLNAGGRHYGVDLNRNYSFGWGTGGSSRSESSDVYMGPKPFSEPETLAVKQFVETHANLRVLLSFHTFSELILYPWGGKYDGIGGKDQQVFETMARTMAQWNKYTPQQASDLYIASGDTCDWAYGEHGLFCFTFELSPKSMWNGGFYPGTSAIDKTFRANIKPTLYLLQHAADPYGAVGAVRGYFSRFQ